MQLIEARWVREEGRRVAFAARFEGRERRRYETAALDNIPAFGPSRRKSWSRGAGRVGSAPGKVILVGDINSDPAQPSPDNLAFSVLIGAGMADTWAVANPGNPGLTCCFSELLDDPSASVFDSRIDHVLTKGAVGVTGSRVYGTDPDNRAVGGLWPSDHAGVTATLTP